MKAVRWWGAFGLVGVLLALRAAEEPHPVLPLGSKAPEFHLPGVDGRTWSLADFKESRLLVVMFTCNHCPTAQYYEERIKQLVKDYGLKGVGFVAISPNDAEAVRPDELGYTDLGDSLEEMKIRAADRKFNFPYLYGGGEHETTSRAYGPAATPHVFVFDAERRLRYCGRIDDAERIQFVKVEDLRRALDALLVGHEPPVTQTKVFGCSTKWAAKREGVKEYWDRVAKEPVSVSPVDAAGLKALGANTPARPGEGKLRLVNVWATWCGPCIAEFPDLMKIHRMYRGREFEVVTVAAQYPDEQEAVLAFLKKQQATTKNLILGDTDKYKLLEALDRAWSGALPFTLLVDADGQVLLRKEGSFDPLELRRRIVAELNRRKPW